MADVVLWLVEVTYVRDESVVAQLRPAIDDAGGVMFDNDGQVAVAVTVAASSPAAARTKALRQLPEDGITAVTVHRAVSRRSGSPGLQR